MALPSSGRSLVLAARLSALGSFRLPSAALPAVAVPTVVRDADMERPSAVEALDLEELDRFRFRHPGGKADLDNRRGE